MKEQLIALLKKLGLWNEEKAKELEAELAKVNATTEPPKVDTSKLAPELKGVVDAMQNQVNALTEQNKALLATLTKEREDREKIIKTQQDQAKTEQEKKVKEAVEKAIKDGIFPEAKREAMAKLANADFASYEALVKDMKPDPHFMKADGKPPAADSGAAKIKSPLEPVGNPMLAKVKEFAGIKAE